MNNYELRSIISRNIELLLLLTQVTKAELADLVGVSKPTVSAWVYGRKEPREDHITTLHKVFSELLQTRNLLPIKLTWHVLVDDDLQLQVINYLKQQAIESGNFLAEPYTYEDIDRAIMGDDEQER